VASQAPYSQSAAVCPDGDTSKSNGPKRVHKKLSYLERLMDHPEATAIDFVVGAVILRKTRPEYADAIIDQEYISRMAKVSVRSVATSTKRLARLGFIETTKGHGRYANNTYRPVLLKMHEVHFDDVDGDTDSVTDEAVKVHEVHFDGA